MAKPKKPAKDQHKSGFLVRLPEEFRAPLEALKDKLGQPYTVAVQRALRAYLKANGVEPPA